MERRIFRTKFKEIIASDEILETVKEQDALQNQIDDVDGLIRNRESEKKLVTEQIETQKNRNDELIAKKTQIEAELKEKFTEYLNAHNLDTSYAEAVGGLGGRFSEDICQEIQLKFRESWKTLKCAIESGEKVKREVRNKIR